MSKKNSSKNGKDNFAPSQPMPAATDRKRSQRQRVLQEEVVQEDESGEQVLSNEEEVNAYITQLQVTSFELQNALSEAQRVQIVQELKHSEQSAELAVQSAIMQSRLAEAQIEQLAAESKKSDAEIAYAAAQAQLTKLQSRVSELELAKLERWGDSPEEHGQFNFYDQITDESVIAVMRDLKAWSFASPGADLTLEFTSPGGSVTAAFALFDFIRSLRKHGHKVTIVVFGEVASMGAILLQAGDWRVVGANAYVMIHKPSVYGFDGNLAQLKNYTRWLECEWKKMVAALQERSTLTARQINAKAREDWFLTADEAVKYGFADEKL